MPEIVYVGGGLTIRDNFERADSATVGNGWVDEDGVFSISGNNLVSSGAGFLTRANDATPAFFAQVYFYRQWYSRQGLVLRRDLAGEGDGGYIWRHSSVQNLELVRRVGGSNTQIARPANTTYNRNFYLQMAVSEGLQRCEANAEGTFSGSQAFEYTDDHWDGVDGCFGVYHQEAETTKHAMGFTGKNVTIINLPSGWGMEIYNGEDVVSTATESEGIVALELGAGAGGGLDRRILPYDGHEGIRVFDDSDVEQDVYDSEAIYPGMIFSWGDPGGGGGSAGGYQFTGLGIGLRI